MKRCPDCGSTRLHPVAIDRLRLTATTAFVDVFEGVECERCGGEIDRSFRLVESREDRILFLVSEDLEPRADRVLFETLGCAA